MHMRSSTQRGSQGTTFNLFLPYDAVETSSTESAYRAAEPTIAVEPA
jgi:hypothetical protein